MATPTAAGATRTPPLPPPAGPAAAAPPAEPAAANSEPEFRPLANARLHLRSASDANFGNFWGAVLPDGTPLSHVENPMFWTNHAHRLRASDDLRIEWDGGRGVARAFVREVSGAGTVVSRAVVAIESYTEFGAIPRPPRAGITHVCEYRGPHLQHAVIRLSDGQIVTSGYQTMQAAEQARQAIIRRDPKA